MMLNVLISWVGKGVDLSSQDGVRGSMSSSKSTPWQRDGEGGGMGCRPWGSSDVERQVEAQSPLLFRALLCQLSLGDSEVGRAEQGGPSLSADSARPQDLFQTPQNQTSVERK